MDRVDFDGDDLRNGLQPVLGAQWRSRLSAASGITLTQIRRWEEGQDGIPKYVALIVRLVRGEKLSGIDQ